MFSRERTIELFNEWMLRYTETPEIFEQQWQTVVRFLEEKKHCAAPTYGDAAVAYMEELDAELRKELMADEAPHGKPKPEPAPKPEPKPTPDDANPGGQPGGGH